MLRTFSVPKIIVIKKESSAMLKEKGKNKKVSKKGKENKDTEKKMHCEEIVIVNH